MRREKTKAVRKVMTKNNEGRRGRPKKGWFDTIENDMRAAGVCVCVCVRACVRV